MNHRPQPDDASAPPLPAMFARYKDLVEQELSAAVPDTIEGDLSLLIQYHLGWADRQGKPAATGLTQGKALRPTLCMFACEALQGDLTHAKAAAAALELIHNFSLIHDDIQDQDRERRHQPTVWVLWGLPKALEAGDAMQCLGDLALLNSAAWGVPPETTLKISAILTESCLEMIEGQCLDLNFESRTAIATEDYLGMIAGKTGALIRSAVEIGATLATDEPEIIRAFANFGGYLGRAFQIQDDYLGVWGVAADTGKSTANDIRRKKKSFPAVFALERAGGSMRQELLRIYGQDELDDADVAQVMTIMDELGAGQSARALTRESAERAANALSRISLPPWVREEVADLVDFMANRRF